VERKDQAYLIFTDSNLILVLEFERRELKHAYYNFSQKLVACKSGVNENVDYGDHSLTAMIHSIMRAFYIWCLKRVYAEKGILAH
jgi:hypothetical protein